MIKLKDITVFGTLKDADLKEVERYLITDGFSRRETIFSESDPSEWFYIVLEGKVKITKVSHEGKEIILEVIHPGDFFGGLAVIRGFPYPANAVAMEDTKTLRLSRQNLMALLDRFPSLMYCLVQNLGDRMRDSHETMKNIALEKVGSRIASLLLKLSEQTGKKTPDGISLELKLTKQDIAEMVGTTVETAIRVMSRFKKSGLLSEKGGRIIIKDTERLKTPAG